MSLVINITNPNPVIQKIGNSITITASLGTFDNLIPSNNTIYFGNIIADVEDDSIVILPTTITVNVPNGTSSCNVHVQTSTDVSNEVPLEIPYEDEVFINEHFKSKGKFNSGPGRTPIYNRDLSITGFSEIVDENSIIQNVYNILLTRPGERFFNQNFGCAIHNRVFDLIGSDSLSEKEVLNIINDALTTYEPRAILIKDQSFIDIKEDNNAIDIVLAIRIPSGIIREIAISIGKGINSV